MESKCFHLPSKTEKKKQQHDDGKQKLTLHIHRIRESGGNRARASHFILEPKPNCKLYFAICHRIRHAGVKQSQQIYFIPFFRSVHAVSKLADFLVKKCRGIVISNRRMWALSEIIWYEIKVNPVDIDLCAKERFTLHTQINLWCNILFCHFYYLFSHDEWSERAQTSRG